MTLSDRWRRFGDVVVAVADGAVEGPFIGADGVGADVGVGVGVVVGADTLAGSVSTRAVTSDAKELGVLGALLVFGGVRGTGDDADEEDDETGLTSASSAFGV